MHPLLRWLLGLAAGLIGLIAVAVIVLTVVVDANSYRDEIEAAVRDSTGRELQLQGDIELAWFPWLALETGAAQLGNPPGFPAGPPLLRWSRAYVGVRAWPLLSGTLVVDRVRVEGLQANLRVAADGRANWQGFMQPGTDREARDAPTIPRNAGLEIRDGGLEYSDARSGRQLAIRDWDLDVGAVSAGEPVPVQTQFVFRDLPIELREEALTLDFDALHVRAPAWSVRVGDARFEGALDSQHRLQRLTGTLRGRAPSLRTLLAALGTDAPRTRDEQAVGAMQLAGTWVYEDGALTVDPLEVRLDDTTLRGSVGRSPATGAEAAARWRFELRGDRIDLDRYREPEGAGDKPFELPVKQLQDANVAGTLTFDAARVAGGEATDVKLRVISDEAAP